jgi:hypothetical protein
VQLRVPTTPKSPCHQRRQLWTCVRRHGTHGQSVARARGPRVAMSGTTPAVEGPKPPLARTSCIREPAFTAEKQNDWRIVVSDGKVGSMKTGERGECGCIRFGLIPARFCFLICIDSTFIILAKILLAFDTLPPRTYTALSPNRHNHVEQ